MLITNSYWGGVFDGEGNIYFAKDLKHISVSVAQKEVAILYMLRLRFGGRIYKSKSPTRRWEVFNKRDCVRFLETVKPYLIVKRVEAEIALEAMTGWRQSRYYNNGMNSALPQEEMDRRRILKERFDADRAMQKTTSPLT